MAKKCVSAGFLGGQCAILYGVRTAITFYIDYTGAVFPVGATPPTPIRQGPFTVSTNTINLLGPIKSIEIIPTPLSKDPATNGWRMFNTWKITHGVVSSVYSLKILGGEQRSPPEPRSIPSYDVTSFTSTVIQVSGAPQFCGNPPDICECDDSDFRLECASEPQGFCCIPKSAFGC